MRGGAFNGHRLLPCIDSQPDSTKRFGSEATIVCLNNYELSSCGVLFLPIPYGMANITAQVNRSNNIFFLICHGVSLQLFSRMFLRSKVFRHNYCMSLFMTIRFFRALLTYTVTQL